MFISLLVEEYRKLPKLRRGADAELWHQRFKKGVRRFCRRVSQRYNEGTLQRLLESESRSNREAAVLALGSLGTSGSNPLLARMLHDEDETVASLAVDALWELWFRGGTEDQNRQLQSILHLTDSHQAMIELNRLLQEAPDFVEVINQRAILHFQHGEFRRSLEDCQRVVERNPFHFGAQCGIGHCYLKMRMPNAAIHAYRQALKINPTLSHLQATIQDLQQSVNETDESF